MLYDMHIIILLA